MVLHILHLALGGCLKAPPVKYGVTVDTGGHIAYILDAARYQARQSGVTRVTIVTRAFIDERLDPIHAQPTEQVAPHVTIERIATDCMGYLEKEALAGDLPAFIEAFCIYLAKLSARPDVIHAHFADAAAVAIAAERRFGIPFVFTPHALGIDKRMQGIGDKDLEPRIAAERRAIAAASAVIVSSQDEAKRQIAAYRATTADRIHCVFPGVPRRACQHDGSTLADRLGAWLTDPSLPIILAIARPVAKKNLAALVRAYAGDVTLRARANLIILAGQHDHAAGEERAVLDELQRLAQAPDLAGRVALPPRHDAEDVAALYALAAKGGVFVNPALHEPFGLTLLEAAEVGVPVVATRNGGAAEIVARIKHGLSVNPHDDSVIAAAISAIIGDAQRHKNFAAAARAGVIQYSWDCYAAASVRIYRDLAVPRLLACDLDGTLTGCPSGAAIFAAWCRSRPISFVVATGRGIGAAQTILCEWGLPDPDAFIVDVGTRLFLADERGRWYECAAYAKTLDAGWDRAAVERVLLPLGIEAQPTETAGPHKLSFFGSSADAELIRQKLEATGLAARVIFSHGSLIDVLAPLAGKAGAIAAYAAKHGWSLAQCIAAGDSGNDIDMLTACGHAIVPANASEELAALPARAGLHRVAGRHAGGVLEGLKKLGVLDIAPSSAVAA